MAKRRPTEIKTATIVPESYIIVDLGYLKSPKGVLNVLQIILGICCVAMIGSSTRQPDYGLTICYPDQQFFFLVTFAFLVGTSIRSVTFAFSYRTTKTLEDTIMDPLFYFVGVTLYLASSIVMLAFDAYRGQNVEDLDKQDRVNSKVANTRHRKMMKVTASIGIVNGILYSFSFILSLWMRRRKKDKIIRTYLDCGGSQPPATFSFDGIVAAPKHQSTKQRREFEVVPLGTITELASAEDSTTRTKRKETDKKKDLKERAVSKIQKVLPKFGKRFRKKKKTENKRQVTTPVVNTIDWMYSEIV